MVNASLVGFKAKEIVHLNNLDHVIRGEIEDVGFPFYEDEETGVVVGLRFAIQVHVWLGPGCRERSSKRNGRVVRENGEVTRERDGSFRVPYDGE